MTNEQFDVLISRFEDQALRNPNGYQFKVLLLALLGNAYFGAILLLIVVLLVGLIAAILVLKVFVLLNLIIIVGLFLWTIWKALWVKIEAPEGTEVQANQAPELFSMIDELRCILDAPRFYRVLITEELNAGVKQLPRLGFWGWHHNYLEIGLPLMKSLTVGQFKAVLAHELGHLAKQHGRVSNWIYRQRLRWSRILVTLDANHSRGSFLFKPFINWFSPYFNAYSFPLARANEFEADATSARLVSPRAAAEALTSVNVVGRYLVERYWPQILQQADEHPQPSFVPYSNMGYRVAAELDDTCARDWLDQAMARETTSSDTHPALNERLKAIGETPRFVPPAPNQAADRLLGTALNSLTESFDHRWQVNILSAWQERHRVVQEGRRNLAELNAKYASGAELTMQDAYDRATLTESIAGDADAALDQFRVSYERDPNHIVICLNLGARLLARNDEAGCALVERALHLDEDAIIPAAELLRDYYLRINRVEDAHAWHQRIIERLQLQKMANHERTVIYLSDKFERHDLSQDIYLKLRTQLKTIPELRQAYFVKKQVKYFAYRPCYVLGFSVTGPFRLHSKKRARDILKRIQESVLFHGETIVISVDGGNYRFGRKFRWMRGARIL